MLGLASLISDQNQCCKGDQIGLPKKWVRTFN